MRPDWYRNTNTTITPRPAKVIRNRTSLGEEWRFTYHEGYTEVTDINRYRAISLRLQQRADQTGVCRRQHQPDGTRRLGPTAQPYRCDGTRYPLSVQQTKAR